MLLITKHAQNNEKKKATQTKQRTDPIDRHAKHAKNNLNLKSAQRDAHTARALVVVRFGHPPARPSSAHCRQD